MDASIEQLLPQIREALTKDAGEQPAPIVASVATLLPDIREALAQDEAMSGADDVELARRVSDLLPKLLERLRQTYLDARGRLAQDFPWTLPPLDWEMDLLGSVSKARSETLHTQCLAYLFDSRGTHGLGTRVLREFFRLLGRLVPGEDIFEHLTADTEGTPERLQHVRVVPEHCIKVPIGTGAALEDRRCDLWLDLVEEGRALVVIIENKIDANEHNEQLAAYEQAVWKWAREHRVNTFEQRLVFLTPEGRLPAGAADHQAWLPISYKQLAAVLAHAARDAPEPGRTYLLLYVSTLLKSVLGITAQVDEINFVRRLLYMNEVIGQGGIRE